MPPAGYFSEASDPRIVRELFEAERDALLFLVEFQDDDFEFLIGFNDVGRVLDAAPAQIGEVQQAVDAAEIDEGAVLGDVFHVTFHLVAFVQRFHELRALGVELFFEQSAAADDHVAATSIQLGDANLDFRVHQVVEVGGRTKVVLRTRKKRAHADINDQAALDAIDDFAGDRFLGFESGFDFFPSAAAKHFLVREDNVAVFVLTGALYFDSGVRLRARNVGLGELDSRDQPFGLATDVNDDAVLGVGDYFYFDDFVVCGALDRLAVLIDQLGHFLGAGGLFGGGSGFGIQVLCCVAGMRGFCGGSGGRCCLLGARIAVGLSYRRRCRLVSSGIYGRFSVRLIFNFLILFGFVCGSCCGRSRIVIVGKHGCWPPERYCVFV